LLRDRIGLRLLFVLGHFLCFFLMLLVLFLLLFLLLGSAVSMRLIDGCN